MKRFYPKSGRVILHVDMNSFFASVEMAQHPSLKGKPLAIAGDAKQRKGIIVTCSYEARKFGVKTTMPVWKGKKLCPNLIIRPPNHEKYREVSKEIFKELRNFTDQVEPVSIDEGYIDITDCYRLGTPVQIAKMIQQHLLDILDLPCSIGIAPNKFLAKMASDMKKPLGITVLRKRDIQNVLWPQPVIQMHGVGKKTARKLATIDVFTIKDIAHANDIRLEGLLGIRGLQLKERANGIDLRPVDPEAAEESKSIGSSVTLPRDMTNQLELLKVLQQLANKVSFRLKRNEYVTMNVSIMIRYGNRNTITRSRKLSNPIIDSDHIFQAAKRLFIAHWNNEPVRLLGVTGQDLLHTSEAYEQLNLFSYEKVAKKEPLDRVVEMMKKKYGRTVLQKGFPMEKE